MKGKCVRFVCVAKDGFGFSFENGAGANFYIIEDYEVIDETDDDDDNNRDL